MPPISWDDDAWDDYTDWMDEDKKTVKRINRLIKSISRDPRPIGTAEILKHRGPGVCSVRIDDKNRLVYKVLDDGEVYVLSCRGHYAD